MIIGNTFKTKSCGNTMVYNPLSQDIDWLFVILNPEIQLQKERTYPGLLLITTDSLWWCFVLGQIIKSVNGF